MRNAVLGNFSKLESRTDAPELLENYIVNEFHSMGFKPKY